MKRNATRLSLFNNHWTKLPLFWRFQLFGWLVFIILTFPLKVAVLETVQSAVLASLYNNGIGFLTTLGMREVYRRIYRDGINIRAIAFLIIGVSLSGAFLFTLLTLALHDKFHAEEEKIFKGAFIFSVFYLRINLCICWSLLYFGIKLGRERVKRNLQLARSEARRHEAELQMLRAQINPHFLFNAFNAIRSGLEVPACDLRKLVEALSAYLRYALKHGNNKYVPLGEEYDALMDYLTVEKARFLDDLKVTCRIENEARTAAVPGIILQPLVENAIKHGRETSFFPLKIHIQVTCPSMNIVKMEVSNTGKWIERRNANGGIGLKNLHRRLALLYPNHHQFEIIKEEDSVTVRISIPKNPL